MMDFSWTSDLVLLLLLLLMMMMMLMLLMLLLLMMMMMLLLLLLLLLLLMMMMMTTNRECLNLNRSHRVCHQRVPAAVQGEAGLAATAIATVLA